jgi:hypothetical protein
MRRKSLALIATVGLLAMAGSSTYAWAAASGAKSRSLKITLYGAQISTGDYAFKAISSLDGAGAAVTHVTSSTSMFPVIGKSVTAVYFRDGVSNQRDSFRQKAPNANGISKFTGSGVCAGGTGIHRREKCSYTFTGTYNVKTNQNDLKITGTDTR